MEKKFGWRNYFAFRPHSFTVSVFYRLKSFGERAKSSFLLINYLLTIFENAILDGSKANKRVI